MSDTTNILAGVNLLADLLLRAKQAYDVHREAAKAAGVPESAMRTADAILARDDADPLEEGG